MDAIAVERSITRLSHEILEKNGNPEKIVLIGIHKRGVPLAARIQTKIHEISGAELEQGSLDITFHRDDYRERLVIPQVKGSNIPFSLDGKVVVLVDDVLYTGRTVRAAFDALIDFGRPRSIQLVVLVDRGHRELPIKADYVGKNLPTALDESIQVHLQEADGKDEVVVQSAG